MRDAYKLLGLKPGVSPTDIKRAFRRLAMHWHPDRNDDPVATEHFKALRRAHDRLLDALSTAAADGAAAPEQDTATSSGHGAASSTAPDSDVRGADRFMELELEFEEAFSGGSKQIRLSQSAPCTHCEGRGEVKLSFTRLCTPCRGTGRVRSSDRLQHCPVCAGRGYRSVEACPSCEGSGKQSVERWLALSLPAGLIDGDSLRLAGEGEPHPEFVARPGDLHLHIRLRPHALYSRRGRDLLLQRPVSALRLLLGGEVRIPHPGGERTVKVDAGTASARSVCFHGEGFPARAGRPCGNLIIEFEPITVGEIDASLRERLEALETELQRKLSDYFPELAAWEANWLQDRRP
jgi:molecular chaperone DnaJ